MWAAKGDLVLRTSTTTAPYQLDPTTFIELSRSFPGYGGALILLSFLIGQPAGGMLVGWAMQRAHRARPPVKARIVITGSLVLPVVAIALTGMSVAGLVAITDEPSVMDLLTPAATLSVLSGIPAVIPATAAAVALMLLLTVLPLPAQGDIRARTWTSHRPLSTAPMTTGHKPTER